MQKIKELHSAVSHVMLLGVDSGMYWYLGVVILQDIW